VTKVGILGSPRPAPSRRFAGPLAGALVIALTLPIFALAGWSLKGWAIAAVLWLGVQAFGLLLGRVRPSSENLAASGALAAGMMLRLLAVLVVLMDVASSDRELGLSVALVYGAAYTAELAVGLLGYYGQEPTA
jgi:hypothetical protein